MSLMNRFRSVGILVALLGVQACDSPSGLGSFPAGTCVIPTVDTRDDRLRYVHAAALGSEGIDSGPGYLIPATTISHIVRDSRGRYWVGQDQEVKVFDLEGEFVATVGRAGEGPLEFGRAHPFHVDNSGHVHVFDQFNNRVSVIGEDFQIVRDSRVPSAPLAMAPLDPNDDRYVFAAWIPSPQSAGFPLHIVDGGELVQSFGIVPGHDTVLDRYVADKRLSTHGSSDVFSAPYWDYTIQAWVQDGSRSGKLEGPTLDDGQRGPPGRFTLDNPPWNRIRDIKVDALGRVWVIVQIRQPDWTDHAAERISPSGVVSLEIPRDDPAALYRSRVDVLDPADCRVVASRWFDNRGVLSGFVDGAEIAVSEFYYGPLGDPLLDIWDVAMQIDK